MFSGRTVIRCLPLVLLLLLLGSPLAHAELYIAGYLGGSVTQSNDLKYKDNITFGPGGLNATVHTVDFSSSLMGGGKVGYWFGSIPYLGFEVEGYHFNPDINQQTKTVTGTFRGAPIPAGAQVTLGVAAQGLAGFPPDRAAISVTGLGFHLLGRLRFYQDNTFPNGRLQPYLGVGPALFFSEVRLKPVTNQSDESADVGVQGVLGTRFLVHPGFSAFAEYKFSHFTTETSFAPFGTGTRSTRISMDLNSHHIYGGVAVHFDLF